MQVGAWGSDLHVVVVDLFDVIIRHFRSKILGGNRQSGQRIGQNYHFREVAKMVINIDSQRLTRFHSTILNMNRAI